MTALLKIAVGIAAVLAAIFILLNLLRFWIVRKAGKLRGRKLDDIYPAAKLKTGFIYFFSPSCAPCRQMTPILHKLENAGIPGWFVDVSKDMAPARALGVIGTPAVVMVESGVVTDVTFGMQPEEMLKEKLNNLRTNRR